MNKLADLIKSTFVGKSFYRILFNWAVYDYCVNLGGDCVDLAAGKNTGYAKYWRVKANTLVSVDINRQINPDIVADLNLPLPLEDNSADNVFFFNSFYLIERPVSLFEEIYRVLKKDGRVFFTVEFVKSEEQNVRDRQRYTSRKINEMLKNINFQDIKVVPVGERFCAAGNLIDFACGGFIFVKILKIFGRLLCLSLDRIWPKRLRQNYPCPISWFAIAKK